MNPERFARVKEYLLTALSLGPAERDAYLREACGQDTEMEAEVRALLAQEGQVAPVVRTGALAGAAVPAIPAPGGAGTRIPDRIGPYRILGILGEGGMGIVYHAEQESPVRREVALKVIRHAADSALVAARFETERQVLAQMDHPHIARLLDAASTADGRPYFAMELVRGAPLTDYCREARVDMRARLELFLDVCRAVRHAHRCGVIHRDLKPSNVLVTLHQDRPMVKVIDFSIAKALGEGMAGAGARTRTGQIIGTLEYMSPEQALGAVHTLDTRSDVYALGVILYELLTDRLPHDVGDVPLHEAVRRIAEEPPRSLRRDATTAARRVDADIDTVVRKCLEKEPERRYGSAAELCEDLERYLSSRPILARPPSATYTLRKLVMRHRLAFAAVAAVIVVLLVGIVGTSIGLVRAARAREEAEEAARLAGEKAAIAEALNQFLVQDLLSAPTPNELGIDVPMREVVATAAGKIEGKFADQPRVEAAIRRTVGWFYDQVGETALAEPHLLRALELFERTAGPDDPETHDCMSRLAALWHAQGHFAKAAGLHEELLKRRRRILGDENRLTVQTMSNLGSNYMEMGRYADAEPLLMQAIEGRRRILGEHHRGTYRSKSHLAALYLKQGRNEDAEKLLAASLEGIREHIGTRDTEFCITSGHLADVYKESGRPRDALPVIEGAVDSCRQVWGDKNKNVADVLEIASLTWIALGEWDRARTRLEAIRAEVVSAWGEDSLPAANVLWLQGRIAAAQGHVRQALPMMQRSLSVREKSGALTAGDLNFLRACQAGVRGDGEAALTLLQQAVDAGYARHELILVAPELQRLRDDARFDRIVEKARGNRAA